MVVIELIGFVLWENLGGSFVVIHSLLPGLISVLVNVVCFVQRYCIFSEHVVISHLISAGSYIVTGVRDSPSARYMLWRVVWVLSVSLTCSKEVVADSLRHLFPFLPKVIVGSLFVIKSGRVHFVFLMVSVNENVRH